jgi:hypothetical protein
MLMLEIPMEAGSFDKAFNQSDCDSRNKWRSSIDKEFKGINMRIFWKKINKSEMLHSF